MKVLPKVVLTDLGASEAEALAEALTSHAGPVGSLPPAQPSPLEKGC